MTTNPARFKTPLVLERLEVRAVPAAYSWDANLIAQMYPAVLPPSSAVSGASNSATALADYRLASNGYSAGTTPTVLPANSDPAPIGSSAGQNTGGSEPSASNAPPPGAASLGNDFFQSSNGAPGQPTNQGVAAEETNVENPGGGQTTAGAPGATGNGNWFIAPNYGQLRFASNLSGVAVQDLTPTPPPGASLLTDSASLSVQDLTLAPPPGASPTPDSANLDDVNSLQHASSNSASGVGSNNSSTSNFLTISLSGFIANNGQNDSVNATGLDANSVSAPNLRSLLFA